MLLEIDIRKLESSERTHIPQSTTNIQPQNISLGKNQKRNKDHDGVN